MSHRIRQARVHRVRVSRRTDWLLVELVTSEGLTGVGEFSDLQSLDSGRYLMDAAVPVLADHVVGEDPMIFDSRLTDRLASTGDEATGFQRRLVCGALVTAVCDIEAQVADESLAAWLGASMKPSIVLYANINRAPVKRRSDEFAAVAAEAVAAGFHRVKLAPFDGPPEPGWSILETGIRHLTEVRRAVGPQPEILVDVHHRLASTELLPAVRAMEEIGVGWVEDAVDVCRPEQLAALAEMTAIPLAGGEKLHLAADVASVCASGLLDYLLLDPKYVGGPLRFRSLLAVVDGVELTIHDPTGPVSTAVSAQLSMLRQDAGPLEFAFGERVDRESLVVPGERVADGRLFVPAGAGTGLRIAEDLDRTRTKTDVWDL